jgi:hypothetical protein
MEPVEKPVAYTTHATVTVVDHDNGKEWYFETHNNRYWTGFDRPPLAPGDRVKITISKEPSDARSRNT